MMASAAAASGGDDDDGYDDFTLATPWERFVAALEEVLTGWLAAGPVALTAESEAAAEGGAPLRAVQALVPLFLPSHTEAYRLTLFFPARDGGEGEAWAAPPEGAAPAPGACDDPFPAGAHRVTRRFGVREFLLLAPARASGSCLRAEEAASAASALACARAGAAAPWPGFVATHDPQRRGLAGLAAARRTTTRYEADAVSSTRAAAHLASPAAMLALLAARAAAALPPRLAHAAAAASPELFAAAARATVCVRQLYDLPPPPPPQHDAARTSGTAPPDGGSDSDGDGSGSEDDVLSRGAFPRPRSRSRRALGSRGLADWDDGAPWAPWVALPPPFGAVRLAATWRDLPAASLLAAETEGRLPALLAPAMAHAWTLRADAPGEGSSAGARRSTGGASSADDDGRRGSLGGMLRALAAAMRAAAGAESQGALASGEFWDSPAAAAAAATLAAEAGEADEEAPPAGVPRAPPEHVLQDVLRDVFQALPLPPALGGMRRSGSGNAADSASADITSSAAALFSPPAARSCPGESLLARVALHALAFGNARAVALLWQRVVREIRFMHWERGVPLPRMGPDSASAAGVPDFCACLVHQKLQLLNICIARRAEEAAEAARAAAEARERGGEAAIAAAAGPSRARAAHEARAAAEAAATRDGWDAGWGDADDADGWEDAVAPPESSAEGGAEGGANPIDNAADEDEGFATASEGGGSDGDNAPSEPATPPPPGAAGAAEAEQPTAEVGAPRGVAGVLPFRLLRWPHSRAHAPRTQRPPALTEDALRAQEAALAALGAAAGPEGAAARARLQAGSLLSDMAAFKAANLHQGGGVLADFVRWHSPRDWLDENADEGVEGGGPSAAAPALVSAKAPRGRLSARMAAADNVWRQLWAEARPACAAEQKPLQDPTAAGEGVLHWLETVAPADLFAALMAAAASATGALLAAAPAAAAPSATVALRDAAAQAQAVLARACPYPEEWRAMCDAIAHAEAVVARAEWLRRRLPAAPRAAEALLAASLASAAPAEAAAADEAERASLVAAALSAADPAEPLAAREFLICAATPGPPGAPLLRHRLHAAVAPGRAEVATAVAAPEP